MIADTVKTEIDYQAAAQARIGRAGELLDLIALLLGKRQDETLALGDGLEIPQPGLELLVEAQRLQARALSHRQGMFTIMVYGEFSRGKSTLLNALLQHSVLPSGMAPTTAVIQVLRYGDRPDVVVYDRDNQILEVVSRDDFANAYSLADEDGRKLTRKGAEAHVPTDRFAHISHAEIELDHPLLQNFVRLVDSPGLGESYIRSAKADDFNQKADATIFVLDATQLLTENELQAIERLRRTDGYRHVFFVVNKLNAVFREKDRQEVQARFHSTLSGLFTDEHGQLNADLFRQRLFYVNAIAAEEAALAGDREALAASGIVSFSRELQRFVASPDRVTLQLDGDLDQLRMALPRATATVAEGRQAQLADLGELTARKARAETILKELRSDNRINGATISAIQVSIQATGTEIANAVYASLIDEVKTWKGDWTPNNNELKDVREAVNISSMAVDMVEGLFHRNDPGSAATVQGRIAQTTQAYLESKLVYWQQSFPGLFNAAIDKGRQEQEERLLAFAEDLAKAKGIFVNTEVPVEQMTLPPDPAFSITGFGLHGVAGNTQLSGLGTTLAMQIGGAIIARVLSLLLPGGWIVFLAGTALSIMKLGNNRVDKNMDLVKTVLFDKLDDAVRSQREEITAGITTFFDDYAEAITTALLEQIDGLQNQMDQTIRAKATDQSVQAELARYDAIMAGLQKLSDDLWQVVTGEPMPDEERTRLFSAPISADGR